METDPEDMEDEEDDWLDTRWAEPGSTSSVLDPGKTGNSHKYCHTKLSVQERVHSEKKVSMTAGPVPGAKDGLMTRMQLNDNKAGMEGLDKEKINQIIYEASKGSKYFENEKKREEQVQRRINEQQSRREKITEVQLIQGIEEADRLLQELEESRDLTHTIVHIDMDAYYAAVEMRDDPSLRDKPMAVGGSDMLSTSNYLARKFGVRAAMPGFIGKKLCPDLVFVKPNYKQYTAVSQQIRQILAQYDPNFCPMSLDEAYLDITEHLKKRERLSDVERSYLLRSCDAWDTAVCLCDLNEVLHPRITDEVAQANSTFSDLIKSVSSIKILKINENGMQNETTAMNTEQERVEEVCTVCGKPFPPYTVEVFDKTVEDAVREMRSRIQQKTRLTASAGIAPNTMLAKVCSDRNKPNGQYRIHPDRQEVMNFIQDLPVRKISGIGKVSETMLRALGAVKCQDLYEKRDLLYHLYSPISFHHFMRICLAIGSTTVERDGERKSISTERTFSELSRPSDLYKKCSDLCTALVEDLTEEELQGKTVSIKIKTVKFEVKTRAHTLQHHTAEFNNIYTAARELLRVEIQAVQPQPLRLRLMGVRLSNLLHQSQCEAKRQDTITGLFKKMAARSPQKTQTVMSDVCHQLEHSEMDLPRLPSMDALMSDLQDDNPVMVESPDTELNLERVDISSVSAGGSNVTKLKPKKNDINSNKSVKLLFKPKRTDNTQSKPDQKEISNNTELSSKECDSNISEIKNSLESKNITPTTKGKRKTGRKKAKGSVTKETCRENLNATTRTDGSEESSGYESSKQPENKKLGAVQYDIHKDEASPGNSSAGCAHDVADSNSGSHDGGESSVSVDKKGTGQGGSSKESQEVQKGTGQGGSSKESQEVQKGTGQGGSSKESQEVQKGTGQGGSSKESQEVQKGTGQGGSSKESQEVQKGTGQGGSSKESQEVQKLKLFQCPVCLKEVECKNLNYFNDHVDVCLFRQISSQEQTVQGQSVVDQLAVSGSNTVSGNRQDNGEKDVTHVQSHKEVTKQKSVPSKNVKESSSKQSNQNHKEDAKRKSITFQNLKESFSKQPVSASESSVSEPYKGQLEDGPYENGPAEVSLKFSSSESSYKQQSKTASKQSEIFSSGPSQTQEESQAADMGEVEFFACPICNVEKIGCSLEEFNEHVDSCLSRRAIKQILDEQKKLSPVITKRPQTTSPSGAPLAKRKRRESAGKMKTIDSFFKP